MHLPLDHDTDSTLSPYPLSLFIGMQYTLYQWHWLLLFQDGPSWGFTETLMVVSHAEEISTHALLVLLN